MATYFRFFFGLCLIGCLGYGVTAHAYVPVRVIEEVPQDIPAITSPDISQVFYGDLPGFPHTYSLHLDKPTVLSMDLREPDLVSSTRIVSAIIVKTTHKGRVQEIARLEGKSATWNRVKDSQSGEWFYTGVSFEQELDPGDYIIEIHTPNNLEKYLFRIGTKDDMTIGYVELIRRIADMKTFYGKSVFWVITSPYVYWPLGVLVLVVVSGGIYWHVRRPRLGDAILKTNSKT